MRVSQDKRDLRTVRTNGHPSTGRRSPLLRNEKCNECEKTTDIICRMTVRSRRCIVAIVREWVADSAFRNRGTAFQDVSGIATGMMLMLLHGAFPNIPGSIPGDQSGPFFGTLPFVHRRRPRRSRARTASRGDTMPLFPSRKQKNRPARDPVDHDARSAPGWNSWKIE